MTKGFPRWIRKDSNSESAQARGTAAFWAAVNTAPISMLTTSQDVGGALPESQAGDNRLTR